MIDAYPAGDCQYKPTLRLPAMFQAIANDGGVFYLYREEPAPVIFALRLRSR